MDIYMYILLLLLWRVLAEKDLIDQELRGIPLYFKVNTERLLHKNNTNSTMFRINGHRNQNKPFIAGHHHRINRRPDCPEQRSLIYPFTQFWVLYSH